MKKTLSKLCGDLKIQLWKGMEIGKLVKQNTIEKWEEEFEGTGFVYCNDFGRNYFEFDSSDQFIGELIERYIIKNTSYTEVKIKARKGKIVIERIK